MVLLWWSGVASAEDCPSRDDRLDLIDSAERSLVEADVDAAEATRRELEAALGCGAVANPEMLARMWLVEGALLSLGGDETTAAASWQAAARVSPGTWNPDLGDMLRTIYETALQTSPSGSTPLSVEPELFRWIGAVDGEVITRFPITVDPGLHLVQVGASEDDVRFARIVMAFPDTPVVVVTGLVEPTKEEPKPEPVAENPPPEIAPPPEPVEHPPVSLHAAIGGAVGLGRPSDTTDEPAVKLLVPVETGVVFRPVNAAWIRAALRAGQLMNGEFAYGDAFGEATSPTTVGFDIAGGLGARQGDLGLLAGYHWPGRVAFRGTVAVQLGALPAAIEGRIGMDVLTNGAPETAFDVLLAFRPRLVRHREGFGDGDDAAE
ncbi:MAG: hypothetical protein KC621_20960 [Myxococcales bacterium]|nr:hypothetical protein [Myxococcales bacterium]